MMLTIPADLLEIQDRHTEAKALVEEYLKQPNVSPWSMFGEQQIFHMYTNWWITFRVECCYTDQDFHVHIIRVRKDHW